MNRATLWAGLGGGFLAILMLAPAVSSALSELASARAALMEAEALKAAPSTSSLPLVAAAYRVKARDDAEAGRAVAARVRALAAASGVLVEQVNSSKADGGVVRVRLRLSGSDKAVVAMVDRMEREAPLIRLARWDLSAQGEGSVRLDGEAVAAWR